MRELNGREYKRILIIKPSSFGDVIHALPVLNGLRKRFPDARISWLVAHRCAGLLEGHPALDEVIPFDRVRYGRIGRSVRVTGEFWRFVRSVRARGFELVVDLQGLFRSGFLAWTSGAPVRIGFGSAREFAWLFYTHRVSVPDRQMHAVDRNYLFAGPLGFSDQPISFKLTVQDQARQAIEDKLKSEGVEPGQPFAVMGPGTRWETKMWPAENFAKLARTIHANHGLHVVLVGMESEIHIASKVADLAGGKVVNLAGRTPLPELIALIDNATLAVMHDSGPVHLATALGKPMVALYGPTSPSRTGPYQQPDSVVRLDLECSPCYIRDVANCPHGHRCMRDLAPESIMERINQILATGAHIS